MVYLSSRADASELLEEGNENERSFEREVFQFALMRVSSSRVRTKLHPGMDVTVSIRADASELLEGVSCAIPSITQTSFNSR